MEFENKIKRLEEINTLLEVPNTKLEDAMKLFEEAVKITKECQTYLEKSRGKITKITITDDGIKEV